MQTQSAPADTEPLRPVSRGSQIPLYHQVANDVRERITSGAWPPGRRIPGDQELSRLYGASRITIRQALANLVHEGLISRQPGRGSFVRDPAITAGPRLLRSFTEEMRARRLRPSSRVLSNAVVPANAQVAPKLGLPPGAPVVRLERLRYGNGEPVGFQTSYLPAGRFSGLVDVDFSDASLYEELERRFETTIDEADESYVAGTVDGDEARHLALPRRSPVLVVERIGSSGGQVVEFTCSIMRADRYRVNVRLRRERRAPSLAGLADGESKD